MIETRYHHAIIAQGGACNPRPLGRILVEALETAERERWAGTLRIDFAFRDAAVQLILHQMCHLAGMIVDPCSGSAQGFDYQRAMAICADNVEPEWLAIRSPCLAREAAVRRESRDGDAEPIGAAA